jgi:hypothetical protein
MERVIISGSPTTETHETDGYFSTSYTVKWTTVTATEERIIEETVHCRVIEVTEHVEEGSGASNYDPSGSWGGGGVERTYTNVYVVRETKDLAGGTQ